MKSFTFRVPFLLFVALLTFSLSAPIHAQDNDQNQSATFQTFYDQLGSQGTWVQTDNYGYAWQPTVNDPNWRPYSNGHWVYTDAGWAWVADDSEPWGWATYHYGRWVNIDGEGWVWVPGYTWAPAWVSWRYGGGYCGWAPLPPATFVGIDFFGGGVGFGLGFHIGGDADVAFGIGPGWYNFVPVGCIGYSNYHGYYVNHYNNYGIINHTTNVTNINVNRGNFNGGATTGGFGHVTVGGPSFATLAAQSREPITRATLTPSSQPGNPALRGNSLAVFAPHVAAADSTALHPAFVSRTLTHTNINPGTDISRPLLVAPGFRPASATTSQVAAARQAEATAPAHAKVATASTLPSHTFNQPLNPSPSFHSPTAANTAANQFAPTSTSSEVHQTTPSSTRNTGDAAFNNQSTMPTHRTTQTYPSESGGNPGYTHSYHEPGSQGSPAAPNYQQHAPAPASHPAYAPSAPSRSYGPGPGGGGGGGNYHPSGGGGQPSGGNGGNRNNNNH